MSPRRQSVDSVSEVPFMRACMIALGSGHGIKIHRQNCGKLLVRNHEGKVIRAVDFGPPPGAADVSGWVIPEGWRLELEFKAADGKQSKEQKAWQNACERGGVIYVLISYSDLLSFDENVREAVKQVEHAIASRRSRDAVQCGVEATIPAIGDTMRSAGK